MSESNSFNELRAPLPQENTEDLGELLTHYWRLLKRYYWVILLTCALGLVAAFFITKEMKPVYQAQSQIIFHQSQSNLFGKQIERVELLNPGDRWQFEQFWNTQREVLRSRWFGGRVVKKLGLLDDYEFLPRPPPEAEARTPEMREKLVIAKLLGTYQVSLAPDSRVANVVVKSNQAELSAKIADAVAETYVEYTQDFQSGGLEEIVTWFDSYVASKKAELEASQSELQKFKRDHNILSLSYENRQNLTANNMATVNEQLMEVRGKLSAESALLSQIREMEAAPSDPSLSGAQAAEAAEEARVRKRAIADLIDNSSLKDAFGQEALLEQELAELRTRYLDEHPRVQAAQSRLDVVRKNIREELSRIRLGVSNRVAVLQKNRANLEQQLEQLRSEVFALNELGVEYSQHMDRAENLKKLYNTVLMRSAEMDLSSLYKGDTIQVLEKAEVPRGPVSPRLPLNLAVGLLIGIALGSAAIVLLDALDTTIKSDADVASFSDKPLLALLPQIDASALKSLETIGETAADTITFTAPKSSFAEGIRTLRTNLMFMAPDNPPRLLLVTSPGPGEGKTMTSVNMAIAMAQSGQKTLIIDADMRRPRLHKALGVENREQGLSSIILGNQEFDQVVQATRVENLSMLSCGQIPPNPSELLHSERFAKLVEEVSQKYDRVIFDSPPLGAVSDALVLSHSVDGVLLILSFGNTQKEMLRRSVDQLASIGAPLMGFVLNEIRADASGYAYQYYYRYSYDHRGADDGDKPRLVG